ncbi:hypothetical protein DCC85_14420 [Paenibacillus sp. CAA11]|uniref:type II toxin-antitoxin system HicB family antitoxin n=1 Tax=Paenibacillus sp. CAA11 TaxID=1532905 RepID=UPI000D3BF3B0|nr:type II toxin-antitoxin system HicB family antitoxin [Paenibacillus sp. CAA11]AWB45303.1 hypothetical protein DCC85_14420 [Paenibacillus sp. CAA11]
MKDRYVYPAVFTYADDGISVEFPDLPGAFTSGDNDEEALYMAKDCLSLHLFGMEDDSDDIPEPTRASEIKTGPDQVVVLVEVWMPPVRNQLNNKVEKKAIDIVKLNKLISKYSDYTLEDLHKLKIIYESREEDNKQVGIIIVFIGIPISISLPLVNSMVMKGSVISALASSFLLVFGIGAACFLFSINNMRVIKTRKVIDMLIDKKTPKP